MQANSNTDSPADPFEIGVKVDGSGQIVSFCNGQLDAALAERVASRLLALANATREEARRAFF